MREVIKNISMKDEDGSHLIVDNIIGSDAPYIDVFQTIGGDEQIREEKVKYGYFYNNKFYKDPEHKIEITDYTSEGNGTVFYIAVNDSNKIYIRQGNSWIQRTDIAKKTLPQVLNSGVNAVKWSENNALGAKNFIPIPDSGTKSIFTFNRGFITIPKLTGLESTQTYIVYFNEVLYGQYYFTIDYFMGSSSSPRVIPSSKLKIGMIENTNQESFITPYFGQTGHLDGIEQLTVTSSNGIKGFKIIVESGISTSGTITMGPMLRLASISDRTFVSYSMTNQQLTKRLPFSLATTTVDNTKTYGYLKDDGKFQAFKSQADIDAAVSTARQGNAAVGDVLEGKTFVNSSCDNATPVLTGRMRNNPATTITLDTTQTSYTIPQGYHSGTGKVNIDGEIKVISQPIYATSMVDSRRFIEPDDRKVIEEIIVKTMLPTSISYTPSTQSTTISPGTYGGIPMHITSVTVDAVPTTTKTVTPTNTIQYVTPEAGKFFSSVTVNAVPTTTKTVTPTTQTQNITPPSGSFFSTVTVNAISTISTTVTPTTSAIVATLDNGKFFNKVTVNAVTRGTFGYYKNGAYTSGIIPDTTTNFVMDIHNSGNPSGATMEEGYYKKFSIKVAPHTETAVISTSQAATYATSNIILGDYHNFREVNAKAIYDKARTPTVTTLWVNPDRNTVGSTFTSQTIEAIYSTSYTSTNLSKYDLYSITYVASTSSAYVKQPRTLYFFPDYVYYNSADHFVNTVFEEISKKIMPMLDDTKYDELDELHGFVSENPGAEITGSSIFYLGMRSGGNKVYRRKVGIEGYASYRVNSGGSSFYQHYVHISFGNSSNGDGVQSNNTNVPLVICGINFG